MQKEGIVYASGRIAVLSVKLLSRDKLERLANCSTYNDAVKVLGELSYGDVAVRDDYIKLLDGELNDLSLLIKKLDVGNYVTNCLLLNYDYLNVKTLLKAKYSKNTDELALNSFGMIDTEELKCILTDDYQLLPTTIATACQEVDELLGGNKHSPLVIDTIIDRAMFKDLLINAKKAKCAPLLNYYVNKIDITNINTLLRVQKYKMSAESLQMMFIDGATFNIEQFVQLLSLSLEDIIKVMQSDLVKQMLRSTNGDLAQCEAFLNSYIRSTISGFMDEALTVLPVVNYFYNKVDEIDNVRLILVCIKNDVDKQQIIERLK